MTLKDAACDGVLSDSQSELVWAILGGLGEDELTSSSSGESALLRAAHLLVSALEGDCRSFKCFLCVSKNNTGFILIMNELNYLYVTIAELPHEALSFLSGCSPDFLDAFDSMVSCFTCLQCHHLFSSYSFIFVPEGTPSCQNDP